MRRLHGLLVRLLALLILLAGAAPARADTPIALWKTFDGRVNFTGIQATVRTASNGSGSPCTVVAPSTIRSATLTLPATAVVVSAQLYWAGSGIPDSTVTFQGNEITASRRFTSSSIGGGFDYFGGAADVTNLVTASGTYNFSGLTVANGAPWCGSQGVLGGFSLLVVYRLSSEPLRVLNIYEGFQHLRNTGVVVNASNFRWNRTMAPTEEKARIGHITWEGDPTLGQDGENLSFEGNTLSDPNNAAGNQFNSFSNVNNDRASHGIDFDVYDTTVTISSANDAVVTAGYNTGQDMVLLNAEILLVPTMQISDLAIKITRTGALKINTDVEYTVTVTNNGPVTESGTITVTNTLPPGMYYTAGIVTGWSCTATATAGTCTYTRGLAPGATAPVLTVKARVGSLGEKTNTVVVKGTTSDDVQANNTASDTGTATNADGTTGTLPPPPPPSYIFTDSKCVADIAIGAAGQTCKRYTASMVGGTRTKIWLTATTSKGVPSEASKKDDTTASFQFMLECENPSSGTVSATFEGVSIPVCAPPGQLATWSNPVNVKFLAKTVSVEQTLIYNDIGKIRLNLKESTGMDRTDGFVSAPLRIDFKRIHNGPHDNPGNITSGGAGFARAGEALSVEVGAVLAGSAGFAPNFGNERLTALIVLDKSVAVAGLASQGAVVEEQAELRKWDKGILATKASWSEVGAVNFTVSAHDPELGTGGADRYLGVQVGKGTAAVGRFYPAYFTTDVIGPFNCPKNLPTTIACPRAIDGLINGAVYSQQPFSVTVEAYNLLNARLQNFPGTWFKPITLSAVVAGGDPLAINLTPPSGKTQTTATTAAEFPLMTSYKLAASYNDDAPRVPVTDPSTIAVRAEASETTLAGNVRITSKRSGEVSDEGDILVLNGRVKLPNALGSDLLRTPLKLRTEYWAGPAAGWMFNARYDENRVVADANLIFKECKFDFAVNGACNTNLLGLAPIVAPKTSLVQMRDGTLWLKAPGKNGGASRRGGFGVRYNDVTAPWLPGATGRVGFGSARSPVIYVREMYF
ncbi:DUF6701 domain-containing protein [Massilia sp. CMS3.1]|uniref:DUF6701 domain-containing protein n=1 Tax=Massilia sp. CMS3.1 TaxID=3373083 RepID=UPI003EE61303